MNMKAKTLTFMAATFAAMASFGCWYNRISYNDYIYGVNNFERHAEATIAKGDDGKALTTYTVKNNMTVDFPVTVTMKLVSDS